MSEYIPQVDDYVIWDQGIHGKDEGWVYFKGDPVDNEKRIKDGWNPITQYITIETSVKPKQPQTQTIITQRFSLIFTRSLDTQRIFVFGVLSKSRRHLHFLLQVCVHLYFLFLLWLDEFTVRLWF